MQGKYDFNRFFSGWFMGSDIKDIRRGNIREMLAWALYAKAQHDLNGREKACIEDVLYWLKMRFQIDAPDGWVGRGCMNVPSSPSGKGWVLIVSSLISFHDTRTHTHSHRYNPKVRPMMLTLEKIQYVHRPLAYYAMLTGLQVSRVVS